MKNIARYLRLILQSPLEEFKRRLKRRLNYLLFRIRDTFLPASTGGKIEITQRFITIKPDRPYTNNKQINLTLNHKFNILGSGWIEVKHGIECKGLHGYRYNSGKAVKADGNGMWLLNRVTLPNFFRSKNLWMLIGGGYSPIDWQLDFKSGHRWKESTCYAKQSFLNKPGVDIKVPWELARLQHLPPLALACFKNDTAQPGPKRLAAEFQNQVLDFAAANPPRFGVHWLSGMDVGIRAANMLLAYDMFSLSGILFGDGFNKHFGRLIYDHGGFIINNLQWSQSLRGNHYLAEITGLLFVAAYLPACEETDCWLAFGVSELISEIDFQFNNDGTHFEGSTAYHCLCTELVLYATALVIGLCKTERINVFKNYNYKLHKVYPRLLPPPIRLYPLGTTGLLSPFSSQYITKLRNMGNFITDILKPGGKEIPQIGDNDSGRLFKLTTSFKTMSMDEAAKTYKNLEGFEGGETYHDEDSPDYSGVVSAFKGLFEPANPVDATEAYIIGNYTNGVVIPPDDYCSNVTLKEYGKADDFQNLISEFNNSDTAKRDKITIPVKAPGVLDGLTPAGYPDFGLYIFKAQGLYMAVRCGKIDGRYNGAHAHNDQLSVELSVEGAEYFTDPGSYLYSPVPELRDKYRSVSCHFAPQLENHREPGELTHGLFELRDKCNCQCIYFGGRGFAGVHYGFGAAIYRVVILEAGKIEILDYYTGTESIRKLSTTEGRVNAGYSKGYGVLFQF
ncbi:MAG: heparinase II/III family protein [Nitrospirae bacterium YQR-1]